MAETKPVDPVAAEEQAAKAKEAKRDKEREVVRKQVEEAAAAHAKLGEKFLKEDAEEAEAKKKAEVKK